jgi:hypothetical protein
LNRRSYYGLTYSVTVDQARKRLEKIAKKHPNLSTSDLWILASVRNPKPKTCYTETEDRTPKPEA